MVAEFQLARLIEELATYTMIVQHRPGKEYVNVDGLSRLSDRIMECKHYRQGVPLTSLPCGGCKYCAWAL